MTIDSLPTVATRVTQLPALPLPLERLLELTNSTWSIPRSITPQQKVMAECRLLELRPVLRPAGGSSIAGELARLMVAFPSKARSSDAGRAAWMATYGDRLAGLPAAALREAVDSCLDSLELMPSIKQVRDALPGWYREAVRTQARLQLALRHARVLEQHDPTPEEREAVKAGFAELIGRLTEKARAA